MKIFTTASIGASILLCLVLVSLFGKVEVKGQHRSDRVREVQEMQITTFLMMISLIGSGVGSALVLRQARQLYREEAMRNMNELAVDMESGKKRGRDE
jgi:hypothetical protein